MLRDFFDFPALAFSGYGPGYRNCLAVSWFRIISFIVSLQPIARSTKVFPLKRSQMITDNNFLTKMRWKLMELVHLILRHPSHSIGIVNTTGTELVIGLKAQQ